MKKQCNRCLALLLMCSMLLTLTGCGICRSASVHSPEPSSAYYTFVSGTAGGQALTFDADKEPCVVLHEDGTATLFLGESVVTCKRAGKRLTVDGSEVSYACSFVGSTLFLKGADAELKLLRSKQEAPTTEELQARLVPPEVGYYLFSEMRVDGKTVITRNDADHLCLVLYPDHSGIYRNTENNAEIVWQDGELKMSNGSGKTIPYALTQDGIAITDDNITITFLRQEGELPTQEELDAVFDAYNASDPVEPVLPDTAIPDADALAFWNRDWYGWWAISDCTGDYADYNDMWWDMCARITLSEDGSTEIVFWDEDLPENDPLGRLTLRYAAPDTYNPNGYLVSESGAFFWVRVPAGGWEIGADNDKTRPDTLVSDITLVDGNSEFTAMFVLRPWGTIWDDVGKEDQPYYYENWYLPLIEAGAEMPPAMELPE